MKGREAEFELGAVKPSQWPIDGLPEFAFVGRSNVGKSSLLNHLLGRRALARISNTPGKTREINFYRIGDRLRFADLPGYGYAAVSKTDRAQFANMLRTYLSRRVPLARVMHLIDIRHEPSADDVNAHAALMQLGLPLCVVATKADKLSKNAINPSVDRIRRALSTPYMVIPVSIRGGLGIDSIWIMLEADLLTLRPGDDGHAIIATDSEP